jgi:RNA-directed DNA polymerase
LGAGRKEGLANGAGGRPHTDWNAIDWRKVQRSVSNLRRRIFRASKEGDHRKVRSLQKLVLRSYANALLSVRRVTQINAGRNTPGVDMLVVKTPKARSELVDQIRSYQPWKVRPARRVYIPKANGKMRPLGIPTVIDRVMQAIVKNALEPYWEARFEPASYGFRPGRSCHDAIAKIFNIARPNKRKKWVLDADIEGAFDSISHNKLLEIIGPFPARGLIRQWLKAGYVQRGTLHATEGEAGVPQGSIIGPLLMNIALHGMEQTLGVSYDKRGQIKGSRALVRYADDWVVFCESEQDAQAARRQAQKWLLQRGLRLSEDKTRIVHLTEGFDFLGFNVRHYPAPKTARSGYKLLIKPSKESVRKFKERMRREWIDLKGHNAMEVLKRLNPIVRGWANYFRIGVSKHTFETLDHWMLTRCARHVRSNHSRKGWRWCRKKYWGALNPKRADRWVFGDKSKGAYLLKLSWTPIKRHVLVKGAASPDDSELRGYWIGRERRKLDEDLLPPKLMGLARAQRGRCSHCGASLFNGEALHRHHLLPKSKGGTDERSNVQLLHLYCHQQIHTPVAPARRPSDAEASCLSRVRGNPQARF